MTSGAAPDGAHRAIEGLRETASAILARAVRGLAEPREDLRVAAVGWATVDTARAVDELRGRFATSGDGAPIPAPEPLARDALLGASAVRVTLDAPRDAGFEVVLLEPDTEGLLAAFLARHGEGLAAVYARAGDSGVSREQARGIAAGPLGLARLLPGQPRWGPFVVVLDDAAQRSPR